MTKEYHDQKPSSGDKPKNLSEETYMDEHNMRKGKTDCFVATATYGTPQAEELNRFRQFRDDHLVGNPVGERFLEAYYTGVGEQAAQYIEQHARLRDAVRLGFLTPVAKALAYFQEDWNPEEYDKSEEWAELERELKTQDAVEEIWE